MSQLEHRRSTAREGVGVLVVGSLSFVCLAIFQILVFPSAWQDDRGFVIGFYAVLAVVYSCVLCYGILNVVKGQEFICRVDDSSIECVSPVPWCGETFKIRIRDIAKVEREEWSESYRWYIWDQDGHRYWLTENYSNPASEIISLVLKKNSAITEIRT